MVVENGDALSLSKGYKQTEIGVIPEDWKVYTFGDIVDYTKGFAFKSKDYKKDGIRIIRVSDTTFDSIKKENGIYIDENDANDYKKWQLVENDLIFTTVGSKPPMYDSMVGKVIMITKEFEGSFLNQNAVLIRGKKRSKELQALLLSHFRMKRYLHHIELIYRGNANQASITLKELFEFKISLPTSEMEQTAISNALSDMDALIAQTEKLIEKKKAIKQGVMQELLKPKEGWVTKKLGEVSTVIKSGGTPLTSNSEFYNGEIPFLSIGDMTSQGKNIRFTTSHITKLGLDNSASWIVPKDSIIYSMYASVGFVSINRTEIAISQAVLGIRFRDDINFEFMYYMLTSMQKQVLKFVGEGTQKNLNARTVKDFDIQLPSYKTQIEIAEILCEIDNNIFSLETKLEKLKHQKQGMMQALLTGKIRLI